MHENELFVLCLGTVVLFFIFFYRAQFRRLPAAAWLLASFASLWGAWLATVFEHFVFPVFFNVLEHFGYAANGLLLLAWCWFGFKNGRRDAHD